MDRLLEALESSALMRAAPSPDAETVSEILFGETAHVLERTGDYLKIACTHDGYEGYVQTRVMRPAEANSTHTIKALHTHLYAHPDFKSPPELRLPFMARVHCTGKQDGGFAQTPDGWVWVGDLRPMQTPGANILSTARRFVDAPYLWGGRSALGIDCSGLVQLCMMEAGIPCPRDTKDQIKTLGHPVERGDIRPGDLVYFPRHVGVVLEDGSLLNATARHMRVVIEDLKDVESSYGALTGIRRTP